MPEDQHALLIKLVESLIQDYKNLASETKRKHVPIKDAAEKQVLWLRSCLNSNEDLKKALITQNVQLLAPFLSGSSTKQQKVVSISLTALQKFVTNECLSEDGSTLIIDALWALMDSNIEELRVLQTSILLLTTSPLVRDSMLSKAFSLCLRLSESKIPAVVNTAAAAVRQCSSATFDRVMKEDWRSVDNTTESANGAHDTETETPETLIAVSTLTPAARDAYSLFQDICSLMNDEPAQWLYQINDISRPLGLDLIESLITSYPTLFRQHPAFTQLLKTNLCPLVIKLFSPSLKPRSTTSNSPTTGLTDVASAAFSAAASAMAHAGSTVLGNSSSAVPIDKSPFAVTTRLMRLITAVVEHYFHLLNTECEIYLCLLIRFLDAEKVPWQRALALEVMHKIAAQPDLIRHVCISYDMRTHSTKVFQETLNALSQYVQSVLTNPSVGDELEPNPPTNTTPVPGQNQSLLYYKGSFFPILLPKSLLMDMLDRSEPPTLPNGYCLSIAFSTVLRIVNSLAILIQNSSTDVSPDTSEQGETSMDQHYINLSWQALLSILSLILESSADDQINSSVLQSLHIMVGLCGKAHVSTARDAFLQTMCNAALPDSFSRSTASSSAPAKALTNPPTSTSSAHEVNFERSPVVLSVTQGAGHLINVTLRPQSSSNSVNNTSSGSQVQTIVSTTASTGSAESRLAASSGSLLITAKHLQSARSLLGTAQAHGNVLGGTGWNILLSTLQNLVWMLGLRIEPTAPLYFKSAGVTDASTPNEPTQSMAVNNRTRAATASVSSDLSTLSSMLSDLFLQSAKLDANALNDLVLGLCQLSSEAMETASINKEPSQFPVVKLTEVGLVNVNRLNFWWDNASSQLLSMCKLSHSELRQLAVNALVMLIKQAMSAPQSPIFWMNETLSTQVLDPLSALSEVTYDDVREKQLECVQHMLHCWGEHIGRSWLRLIEIIGVIRESFKVDLILTAFQCFKLIVTDYLSSLSPDCYPACIEIAARFGQQQQDLNIALTAIGTILHLADHVFQIRLPTLETGDGPRISLEELWLSIFCKLSDLCLDRRSAIRKSACQTLFNTVECHGTTRFSPAMWSDLFWKVLFPLLNRVRIECANAPVEREVNKSSSLLIHHSRDTAAKQWAETVVLTLAGVANLFVSKQDLLLALDEFTKFWSAILAQIKVHALFDSSEISSTALTSFQELLNMHNANQGDGVALWVPAWVTWLEIASHAVELRGIRENSDAGVKHGTRSTPPLMFLPTTSFMTLLLDLFTPIFLRIRPKFTDADFLALAKIVRLGALTPLHVAYMCPQTSTGSVSSALDNGQIIRFQESLMRCVECLVQNFQSPDQRWHLPSAVHLLLALADYAVYVPKPEQAGSGRLEFVPTSYIAFAERCLQLAIDTYMAATHWDNQCKGEILEAILKTLHNSMALKYACPSQSTWLLASSCFFQLIDSTIPLVSVKKNSKQSDELSLRLCTLIAEILQDFLFYHQQPPSSLSIQEFQQHEELDCKFVNVISDLYLSSSAALPECFISRLIHLLSLGSVQASVPPSNATNGSTIESLFDFNQPEEPVVSDKLMGQASKGPKGLGRAVRQMDVVEEPDPFAMSSLDLEIDLDRLRQHAFRENFARLCFSQLLIHAFGLSRSDGPAAVPNVSVTVSRAAVRSILQRCRSTLIQFYQSARLTGKCPLPRARLVEIAYVFRALTIMLTSLQSVSSQRDVDPSTWHHVIDLYPHIVDCILVTGGSPMIMALHRLLRLYGDLLRPACLGNTTANK